MNVINAPLFPLFTKKLTSASPGFVPMTAAFNTTFIKEARFARWIEAATPLFTAAFGYQMSNDDNDWNTTPTAVGSYTGTAGWTYDTGAVSAITTDQRLFVRFGLMTANSSGTAIEQALGRLRLQIKPAEGATLGGDGMRVFTQGTTTAIFHPMLAPVPVEMVGETRPTLRLDAFSSNLLSVQPAYQLSNDGLTWDDGGAGGSNSFTTIGTARTTIGTDYGTTFTTFAPTNKKQVVRWGVAAKNVSGTVNEAGQVALRVDHRRTT